MEKDNLFKKVVDGINSRAELVEKCSTLPFNEMKDLLKWYCYYKHPGKTLVFFKEMSGEFPELIIYLKNAQIASLQEEIETLKARLKE